MNTQKVKHCKAGHQLDFTKAVFLGIQEGRSLSCELWNCQVCMTTVPVNPKRIPKTQVIK